METVGMHPTIHHGRHTMHQQNQNVKGTGTTRREVLGGAAAAVGFMIVPRHVPGGLPGASIPTLTTAVPWSLAATPGDYPTDAMPPVGKLIGGEFAWRQHNGGHDVAPNWPSFFERIGEYTEAPPLQAVSGSAALDFGLGSSIH
jgi:hypothetical protein